MAGKHLKRGGGGRMTCEVQAPMASGGRARLSPSNIGAKNVAELQAQASPGAAAPAAGTQERFALSRPKALSDEPGTVWNATFTRFHALMAMTLKVRSESSFSDSCVRTRS